MEHKSRDNIRPAGTIVKQKIRAIAGMGILVGVAYTWRAMQRAFFGEAGRAGSARSAGEPSHEDEPAERFEPMAPISVPERFGACLLLVASLVVGLWPRCLLDVIVPALRSPLFGWLNGGAGR